MVDEDQRYQQPAASEPADTAKAIMLFNNWAINSDWTNGTDGCCRLAASITGKKFCVPLTGLKVGDKIIGFRILGQIESAGNAATLDADLRKVTHAAADVTDASVGAITQVAASTEDVDVDEEKTFTTAEIVAADYCYYVLVTGTTAAATDIAVVGIELDIARS